MNCYISKMQHQTFFDCFDKTGRWLPDSANTQVSKQAKPIQTLLI